MDAKRVSAEDLEAISELPSKEVLLGRIVGTLRSPHRGLLNVLNGVPRNLVQVINAIKDKKNAIMNLPVLFKAGGALRRKTHVSSYQRTSNPVSGKPHAARSC
jgi:hypothetical protein